MRGLVALKSKLFRPFQEIFRIKLKKPFFIKGIRAHSTRNKAKKPTRTQKNKMISSLLSSLSPVNRMRKMDRIRELRNAPEEERKRILFPSPVTPDCNKERGKTKKENFGREHVEDACRSFENYLLEMTVEEGNVSDLMDVEELLYFWRNLNCPVFIDLVSRFYGEICKDLFMPDDNHCDTTNHNLGLPSEHKL